VSRHATSLSEGGTSSRRVGRAYLEPGKDEGRVVVEPEQDGADDVSDGEVGEQALVDGARSAHEAERGERDAVEQQAADGQRRVRHEARAELDRQTAAAAAAAAHVH